MSQEQFYYRSGCNLVFVDPRIGFDARLIQNESSGRKLTKVPIANLYFFFIYIHIYMYDVATP